MAQRKDYFFRQKVTEQELDQGFDGLENADRQQMLDLGLIGVLQNGVVTEKSGTPDLTVDISGSASVHDKLGQRIAWGAIQNLDVSVDENSVSTTVAGGGNEKIVSVFASFDRVLTDPRIDGNSVTVFFDRAESFAFVVRQGGEGGAPATPPGLDSEFILLADIRRSFGQTQIFNSDITPPGGSYVGITNRREAAFDLSAGALVVLAGTPETSDQAILTELNNHITDVGNAHDASAIQLAVATLWLDGAGIVATDVDEGFEEMVADLADTTGNGGSDKLGSGALTSWLGGRTRALGSIFDQLEAIGIDLGIQVGGDDGCERVGAEAHTAAGDGLLDLAVGSARSQIDILSDGAAAHALNQNVAGDWSFVGNASFANQVNFLGGGFVFSGDDGLTDDTIHLGEGPAASVGYARRFGRVHAAWSHYREDFLGGSVAADFPHWLFGGNTDPTLNDDSTDGAAVFVTPATINNDSEMETKGAHYNISQGIVFEAIIRLDTAITTVVMTCGITSEFGGNPSGGGDGCWVRFDTGEPDSFWTLVGSDGGSLTVDASSTAPIIDTFVRITVNVAQNGAAELFINGVSQATIAAGSVGGSLNMHLHARVETLANATRGGALDKFEIWQQPRR